MTENQEKYVENFDMDMAINLLPVLLTLVKALMEIIKIYKERKDKVTPEERAQLKKLIDLTQGVFD